MEYLFGSSWKVPPSGGSPGHLAKPAPRCETARLAHPGQGSAAPQGTALGVVGTTGVPKGGSGIGPSGSGIRGLADAAPGTAAVSGDMLQQQGTASRDGLEVRLG